ncbi:MAG TPA: GDYXXLXY domain-containing protein [Geminicoccaceae bacterium]|nr:GDYXXLXY domain-containing protein [Geminicoccaceae bacterium]
MIRAVAFWAGLALALGAINVQIVRKQAVVDGGSTVLLRLRPVDPRSLMQGDYMRLAYEEALLPRDRSGLPPDGRIVVALDGDGVARFVRLDGGEPLGAGERLLRYRLRFPPGLDEATGPPELSFGAESFAFQEGHAEAYGDARYGVLRVAEDGGSVLVGLADAERRPIRP